MIATAQHRNGNALTLQGVTKRFGGFKAVEDVDLVVAKGERRAILGPNGAGKTSLFNLITGDLSLTSGIIQLDGRDISKDASHRRIKAGLRRTYQHALLFDGLSVRETLFIAVAGVRGGWRSILPVSRSDKKMSEAEGLAERCGLSDDLESIVGDLSHGQRRQLEVGIVLAGEPSVILLDEPAAGLSPSERPRLTKLLKSLPAKMTIVLVEHDMDIALQTCEQVSVLHNGKILAEGSPEKVMSSSLVNDIYTGRGGHV